MKKLFAVIIGVLSFIGLAVLALSIYLATKSVSQPTSTQEIRTKAAPASAISFSPATISVNPNQPFTVDAMLDPGANLVTAAELHVTFPPANLSLTSVTNGASFPNIFPAAANQSPAGAIIDNTNGTAVFIVGASQTQPVSAPTKVATFTFTAKASAGASPVAFADTTVASALQETGNVIVSRLPAIVTVAAATPTPTPTATPTPTPLPTPTPTGTTFLPGDLDKNGRVDIYDYNIMIAHFGQSTCGNIADINGNCLVDIYDYNILVQNYGKTR